LERLSSLGYTRFILVSHSLGCVKSLLYQGTRKRADVIGVISCSCPKQFYSARAAEQPEFKQIIEQAEALVAQGKGKEFLWAMASGAPALFSAATYVNKYGKHENNDVRPHAGRLGCPHLAIAGGAEHPFFPEYAKELAEAGGASYQWEINDATGPAGTGWDLLSVTGGIDVQASSGNPFTVSAADFKKFLDACGNTVQHVSI